MDVNKWFLSLPPERQAVLREDKWMLANAAAQAATEAEREACANVARKYEPDERCSGVMYASDEIRMRSNA